MIMGRISTFCCVENYVLCYKPVCYKVTTDYRKRIQYSVFFAVVSAFSIDSILYIIIYIIIYNIK